jgi:signal transduction histidine kinase
LDTVQFSLNRALQDVRGISTGLRLPELDNLTLQETVGRAVRAHERRTSSSVALDVECASGRTPVPAKITVYRLVQEALSNAYRHGKGVEQRVALRCDGERLVVEVSDNGPGFEWKGMPSGGQHLGLTGMMELVESLGGDFHVETAPGRGTRVVADLPVQGVEDTEDAA